MVWNAVLPCSNFLFSSFSAANAFTTRLTQQLSSIEAFSSPIWNRWRRNAARSFRFSLMDTTAIKGTQANTTKVSGTLAPHRMMNEAAI